MSIRAQNVDASDVRFGSQADMVLLDGMSALPPNADIVAPIEDRGNRIAVFPMKHRLALLRPLDPVAAVASALSVGRAATTIERAVVAEELRNYPDGFGSNAASSRLRRSSTA
jgi:hypothetical protein